MHKHREQRSLPYPCRNGPQNIQQRSHVQDKTQHTSDLCTQQHYASDVGM